MADNSEALEKKMQDILGGYTDEVSAKIQEIAFQNLREANKMIKSAANTAGFHKGETGKNYIKSFSVKRTGKGRNKAYQAGALWYVKKYYRLAHLLEKGHKLKRHGISTGFTRSFPHIEAAADFACERFEKQTVEMLKEM